MGICFPTEFEPMSLCDILQVTQRRLYSLPAAAGWSVSRIVHRYDLCHLVHSLPHDLQDIKTQHSRDLISAEESCIFTPKSFVLLMLILKIFTASLFKFYIYLKHSTERRIFSICLVEVEAGGLFLGSWMKWFLSPQDGRIRCTITKGIFAREVGVKSNPWFHQTLLCSAATVSNHIRIIVSGWLYFSYTVIFPVVLSLQDKRQQIHQNMYVCVHQ